MPIESLFLFASATFLSLFLYTIGNRNLKTSLYRTLAWLIGPAVLWTIGDALMLGARTEPALTIGKYLFMIAPIYTTLNLLIFTFLVTGVNAPKVFRLSISIIATALSAHILINNPLFDSFTISESSVNTFVVNDLHYSIYSAYFTVFFLLSYIMILREAFRQTGKGRSRSLKIFWAALFSSGMASVTNLILPSLGVSEYVWLGPIFTPAFVIVTLHIVAKNRLFEIRKVIIESTFAFVVMAGIIGILALINSSESIASSNESSNKYALIAIMFLLIGLFFGFVRDKFKAKAAKLFYDDVYDSDEKLNNFSNVLVKEYELESLINKSVNFIGETLKSESLLLILLDSEGRPYKEYKFGNHRAFESATLRDELKIQTERVFSVDQLGVELEPGKEPEDNQEKLSLFMKNNLLSVSAKLDIKDETTGLLILGNKANQNAYTSQDVRLLNIATNELAIAIQNAARFDEIKRFNETLSQEVDKATDVLQVSNKKLRQAAQEIDDKKHQIENIVSSIEEAIFGVDAVGVVIFANASAQNIINAHSSPVGKNLTKLLNFEARTGAKVDVAKLLTKNKDGPKEQNLVIRYSQEDTIIVSVIVMAVNLNRSRNGGFVVVMRDITEKTSIQEERHAYISLLSHELRTPLTNLEGQLSNLQFLTKDKEDDKLTQSVDDAHDQTVNLTSVINQLANYLQADSEKVIIPKQTVDLPAVINNVIEEYREEAEKKDIELRVESKIDDKDSVISTNEMHVRIILSTLVDNAVKFTEKGHVLVKLTVDKDDVQFEVIDTGVGISKHHQLSIFESGKQAENFETRIKGGLGLSLYTASRLAKILGATLSIESEVGSGSNFKFKLPKKQITEKI